MRKIKICRKCMYLRYYRLRKRDATNGWRRNGLCCRFDWDKVRHDELSFVDVTPAGFNQVWQSIDSTYRARREKWLKEEVFRSRNFTRMKNWELPNDCLYKLEQIVIR